MKKPDWEKEFDTWAEEVKLTLKSWDKERDVEICALCGMNVAELKKVLKKILPDKYENP
jgi:hypothetical protein